jgi:hypothetical protein
MKKLILSILFLFFVSFAFAEENLTNSTTEILDNSTQNVTINATENISSIPLIEIKNFFPTTFNKGDSQINIYVLNNGPELTNVGAFIEGSGFSTYNVVPIDSLKTGEKNYIILTGNFRTGGKINLTITINGEKFYQEVVVNSDEKQIASANLENISVSLEELKLKYEELDKQISDKKKERYDVSKVSLTDLKTFIRNTETAVLTKNSENALVNLKLATDEYNFQLKQLASASKIGFVGMLRDNAVLFSAIAGALVTFFTLYEILKKKSSKIVEKVQTVTVTTIKDKKKK